MGYDKAYYEANKELINARARKKFESKSAHAKHTARMKAQRLRVRASIIRHCSICGNEFNMASGFRKYCSEECSEKGHSSLTKIHRSKSETRARINQVALLRYKSNQLARLRQIVNASVRAALRSRNSRKRGSILTALPYSIPQLKAHLEAQFNNRNGFTWENYGSVWHIDHVVPHSLFQYESFDSKQFRDCWALSNLRPLEKIENIRKSNRYDHDYQI